MDILELNNILTEVENIKTRSLWCSAVKDYAVEILENMIDNEAQIKSSFDFLNELYPVDRYSKDPYKLVVDYKVLNFENAKFEVAKNKSEGGCFLIYDNDIAQKLCTKSELKRVTRKDGSLRDPNNRERWIDCQTRALYQAICLICDNITVKKAQQEL